MAFTTCQIKYKEGVTMQIVYEDKVIDVKGQLYLFGKKNYGIKKNVSDYGNEGMILESTHMNHNPKTGKPIYWLKSYGLDSWAIITK
jgi:competence protein ComGF